MLYVFAILMVAVVAVIISTPKESKTERDIAETEERAGTEREQAEAEQYQAKADYLNKCDAFYSSCRKREIRDWDEDDSQIILIGHNVLDLQMSDDEIRKCFEVGKERFLTKEHEKQEEALRQEYERAKVEKANSQVVGKKKYYEMILPQIEQNRELSAQLDKMIEDFSLSYSTSNRNYHTSKPHSTLASAAVTEALFGTAAGVAAAERTRERNERLQNVQPSGDGFGDAWQAFKSHPEVERRMTAKSDLDHLIELKNFVDSSVCSDDNVEDYSRYLEVSISQIKLSESRRNLIVTVKITTYLPKLFNNFAGLDGSLKFVAIRSGQEIGEGYYCAPNYVYTYGWQEPGFIGRSHIQYEKTNSRRVLGEKIYTPSYAIYTDDVLITVDEKYQLPVELMDDNTSELSSKLGLNIEVTPCHLWTVEFKNPPKVIKRIE